MNLLSRLPIFKTPIPLFVKLTLAFTAVTILSMAMSTLFIRLMTQHDFVQYVRARASDDLGSRLATYYQANGGWIGINSGVVYTKPLPPPPDENVPWPMTLVDTGHFVVYGTGEYSPGTMVQGDVLAQSAPIKVNGKTVGFLLVEPVQAPFNVRTPEGRFIERFTNSALISLVMAVMVAVVIGVLSARTLSKPIRALTAATQRVSYGELGYQVEVHTTDELGQLSQSFNQMSTDLARARDLRQRMMTDIAHELRSPLSVILGYAEALDEGKLPASPQIFESLHVEARHLQRLIEDLRLLSLADAGELPLTFDTVSPKALLERSRIAFATQAEQHRVRLSVDVPEQIDLITVDPDRMAQVLGNLVNNALRYSRQDGEIILSAARTDQVIELRVQDNGSGISEKDLPHIFERFYRGDESRHAESNESGLGLAIARSIVEAHGGTIRAESIPGEKTTFTIAIQRSLPTPGT